MSPFSATGSPTVAEGGAAGRRILERHRLLDLHVQDAARDGMHLDVEALHAHGVVDQAAARAAIGERPPFVAHRIEVEIRELAEASGVGAGDAGGVERVAGDDDAVDEGRLRRRGGGGGERGDGATRRREDEAVACGLLPESRAKAERCGR